MAISTVKAMVWGLNQVSGLVAKVNCPLFGAKNGSQYLVEVSLANMMEGMAAIPATWEKWALSIGQNPESFKTSNSAQIAPKIKGLTLDGLDTTKTTTKVRPNVRYMAGKESGANGLRWKKAIANSQPNVNVAEIEAIFGQALEGITDAIKCIKKEHGARLHSLDAIDHAERSYFLTEKVEKAVEIEKAWAEISPPKTVLIRRK